MIFPIKFYLVILLIVVVLAVFFARAKNKWVKGGIVGTAIFTAASPLLLIVFAAGLFGCGFISAENKPFQCTFVGVWGLVIVIFLGFVAVGSLGGYIVGKFSKKTPVSTIDERNEPV